jgi:hypothetical protein
MKESVEDSVGDNDCKKQSYIMAETCGPSDYRK